jgi:hypothetical protein
MKTCDPLKCIPSAAAIRKRLAEARELARKLEILLQTAEGLEHDKTSPKQAARGGDNGR